MMDRLAHPFKIPQQGKSNMIKKIERILVAIDFSEPAFNALDTAVSIAEKCNATLYILYVKDDFIESVGLSSFLASSVSTNSSNILTALSIDIAKKSSVKPVLIEVTGNTAKQIVGSAMKYNCSLLVMGTYGASGYRDGHIGTTAYGVIKYAPCPIMIVPPGRKWTSFRRALLPTRPVLTALRHYDFIREIIERHSTLDILGFKSASDNAEIDMANSLGELKGKFNADKITPKVQWVTGNLITHLIVDNINKNKSDLVVVTPVIDVSNKQFYIGPNTHYVISNAKVPALVINRVQVQNGIFPKMPVV